jgi:tRNA(Ile)-lysidine synthase
MTTMKTASAPPDDPLIQAVEQTMAAYRMVQTGDRVLVGLSGGPDSTTLLLCLHQLAEKNALTIGTAHLNHGLRGEGAARDVRRAAALAKALGLPFYTESRLVEAFRQTRRLSPEEAAREVRYQFLESIADKHGYNRIALGHHQNDDAELLLMRFLRGSGPLGLSGIPPKRSGTVGNLAIIRPLIRVPRKAIETFLARSGVAAAEDESNADVRFLRNRVRRELLPLLQAQYNPALSEGLSRMASFTRDEEDWLADVSEKMLKQITLVHQRSALVLDRRGFSSCHPALQRRVLRVAVRQCKGNLRRIGFAAIEAARHLATEGPASGGCDLPDGIVIRGQGNRLRISHASRNHRRDEADRFAAKEAGFEYQIPGPGCYSIPEAGVQLEFTLMTPPARGLDPATGQQTAFFDMDKLPFPLTIRSFRPGDRMAPLGLGGTQKIKKIFIDRKIAREHRRRYPLLVSGDRILWIVGLRQGEWGKIGPATIGWLKVEVTGCLSGQDG